MSKSDFNKVIEFLLDRKLNTPGPNDKCDLVSSDCDKMSEYPLMSTSGNMIKQKRVFNASQNDHTPNLYLLQFINKYSDVLNNNIVLINFLKEQMEASQEMHVNSRKILNSQNTLNKKLRQEIKKNNNTLHRKKLVFYQNDYSIKNTIFYYNFILNIILFLTAIFVVIKSGNMISPQAAQIIAFVLIIMLTLYMLYELSINQKRVYHNYDIIKFNKHFKDKDEI
jgi:hypothetical protein